MQVNPSITPATPASGLNGGSSPGVSGSLAVLTLNHPILFPLMAYMAGILIADLWWLSLWLMNVAAFTALAATVLVPRWRGVCLPLVLLLAGAVNLLTQTLPHSPHDLRNVQGNEPALVTIRGTLVETPVVKSNRCLAQVEVNSLLADTEVGWKAAAGRVLTVTSGQLPKDFFNRQPVEVFGVLSLPPEEDAPGLFDYRQYLRRAGVYYQLKATTNDWTLGPTPRIVAPLADRFISWAEVALGHGLPEEDDALRLLRAMVLGSRSSLPQETYLPFIRSGTMHLFAISGLHIALIALVLIQVLRVVARVPRFYCGLVVIPLLFFYTAATGWQPSAVRATIMSSVIISGWALARPSNLVNSLAAAAFLILLWDPQQIFGASFQLSFAVVLSIALLVPRLHEWRDQGLRLNPLVPQDYVPSWKRAGLAASRWGWTFTATSVAAWIGSMPLTAYYFQLVSPVTLIANLLVVPASSAALSSALGSLVFHPWLPGLAELFNHSAWFWMRIMVVISEWASEVPHSFFYSAPPTPLQLVMYYVVVASVFSGWLFSPGRGRRVAIPVLGVLAVLCALEWHAGRRVGQVTILPLDGGVAIYASHPAEGCQVLIDCGRTNHVERVVEPFLRAQGINRLRTFALSHGDIQHIGGAEPLVAKFQPEAVCASPVPSRSPVYRRLMGELPERNMPVCPVSRGQRMGSWEVLHPASEDRFPGADDNVLVLLSRFYGNRVLLLSDLGLLAQERLVQREPSLRAEIVIAGVPSKGEPVSDALLDLVRPRLIIITDAEFPAGARASPKLQQRLQARTTPVFYTRDTGALQLRFYPGAWEVRNSGGQVLCRSGDLRASTRSSL